jgi:hypothetical protein
LGDDKCKQDLIRWPEGKRISRDSGVDLRMMLKCILEYWTMMMLAAFIWLQAGFIDRSPRIW